MVVKINANMKKIFITGLLVLSVTLVYSQCENGYFPFREGVKMEMTSYNKKDKEIGKSSNEILSVEDSKAQVKSMIYDKKGELITEGTFEVLCENNMIKMDFKNFVPDEMMDQYENMEVTVEGDYINIPSDLEVGQELNDGSGKMTIDMSGGSGLNMKNVINMTFRDRKVTAKENITTPAGTFDTYKVEQVMVTEMEIMGMSRSTEISSSTWYSKGIGAIKTENYDEKGNLTSYTLLTSYSE